MTTTVPTFTVNPGLALILTFRIGNVASNVFTAWDLTGYTITSNAVALASDEEAVASDSERLVSFTTAITLPQTGSDKGKFVLSLTAEQTAALDFTRAYFDAILEDTGGTKTVYPLGWLVCDYSATEVG